jgi:hypothetical protein
VVLRGTSDLTMGRDTRYRHKHHVRHWSSNQNTRSCRVGVLPFLHARFNSYPSLTSSMSTKRSLAHNTKFSIRPPNPHAHRVYHRRREGVPPISHRTAPFGSRTQPQLTPAKPRKKKRQRPRAHVRTPPTAPYQTRNRRTSASAIGRGSWFQHRRRSGRPWTRVARRGAGSERKACG